MVTQDCAHQTREASKEALKVIYYVIIGIAITEALNRAFLNQGVFLGMQIFETNNLPSLILLSAFIPTICRFVHGASIHFDVISSKRYKPIFDFLGFLLQAALFYLMATSLDKPVDFLYLFAFLLLFDALWLIFLRMISYIEFDKTEIQWLWSDIVIIVIFIVLNMMDNHAMMYIWSLVAISIVAIVATFLDYFLNKDFYFPEDNSKNPIFL